MIKKKVVKEKKVVKKEVKEDVPVMKVKKPEMEVYTDEV